MQLPIRPNRLRQLLQSGQPSLGTRIHIAWPTVIELVGITGMFDYVELLAEYAPFGLFELENQGRAVELFDHMTGMLKIGQESRMHLANRAASSGIQNVLFADIRTVADAQECVQAVRAEAPETGGLRGVGQGRDVRVLLEVGTEAYVRSTADVVIGIMIEKKQAIEDLDAILGVKGIDMVQFGPVDYAMSIGLAGQKKHPQVLEAGRYMIATALKHGVTPRAEIHDPSEAAYYAELGVRHFCLGTDVRTLYGWYKDKGAQMRALFAETT